MSAQRARLLALGGACLVAGLGVTPEAMAQTAPRFGLHGTVGAIDTPTAEMAPDGEVAVSFAQLPEAQRYSVSFQALPWLSLAFRYSGIGDLGGYTAQSGYSLWDRSLDLSAELLSGTEARPSVVLGLRDILGTGVLSGEYVVATKNFSGGVTVSGGLGWGRLASRDPIGSTSSRPARAGGDLGGDLRLGTLFRGDVGAFGSIAWQSPVPGLSLVAEYSPDDYSAEAQFGVDRVDSPWNFGLAYDTGRNAQIGLYAIGDAGLSLRVTAHTNPTGPDLVANRPSAWPLPPAIGGSDAATLSQVSEALDGSGLRVLNYAELPHACVVVVENTRYRRQAEAVDLAAAALFAARPGCARVTVQLAVSGAVASATDVEMRDGSATVTYTGPARVELAGAALPPRFAWTVFPDVRVSLFAPERPIYHDIAAVAQGQLTITPSLTAFGQLAASIAGDFDDITRGPKGTLPNVRTDGARYANELDPRLDALTLDHIGQAGERTFTRLSLGYLETMYAGLSAEVYHRLWRSPFAVGAELNYVNARDYDQRLGLRDLPGLAEFTGHVSAYWDTGYYGWEAQVDAGRYLAGDYGATITLNRQFNNGWEVGAYATLTDASGAEFGEGEFDKGVRFTIPLSTVSRTESRGRIYQRISSLAGDGGQRVNVGGGRLHERLNTSSPRQLIRARGCWQPRADATDCPQRLAQ
jgi:hypothetical protein